jgi:predicted RNA binding protein YcfA (HicA-like mRNA interferase family)
MARLPTLRAQEVIQALEKAGFQVIRQKVSHVRMRQRGLSVKRALVGGAGGFIGGHPENFGLWIANCGFGA